MGEYSSPIDFDSDEEESGITAQEIIHKLGFGAIAGKELFFKGLFYIKKIIKKIVNVQTFDIKNL